MERQIRTRGFVYSGWNAWMGGIIVANIYPAKIARDAMSA
jgi:hypothetical protein